MPSLLVCRTRFDSSQEFGPEPHKVLAVLLVEVPLALQYLLVFRFFFGLLLKVVGLSNGDVLMSCAHSVPRLVFKL